MKRKNKPRNLISKIEKHVRKSDKNLIELIRRAKALYNIVIFVQRQKIFWREPVFSSVDFINFFTKENHPAYRALPAQTAQQVIIQACRSFKAWFKALREYRKNPNKFLGKPGIPKYLKEKNLGTIIFTNQQVKVRNGQIVFPKFNKFGLADVKPVKTRVKPGKFRQVRIVFRKPKFVFEIVYDDEIKQANVNENNILALDLGVNNLIATFSNVTDSILLNGKPLKAMNTFFNKERARLQSKIGNKGTSKRIARLTFKRNCKVNDYLHKASRKIVDFCLEHKIGKVIVGRNPNWKQKTSLGLANNQNFISIPHASLINMLSYKLREYGIRLIETDESYTSKCDHFAKEPMCHSKNYIGKRIKRGLFRSSLGFIFNADAHGAVGIYRKVIGDAFGIAAKARVARAMRLEFVL